MITSSQRQLSWRLNGLVLIWAVLVFGWMVVLAWYFSWPGAAGGPPPDEWPDSAMLARQADEPCLLMFVHPHCPCTRVSFRQFVRVIGDHEGPLRSYVVFIQPSGTKPDWIEGRLLDQAQAERDLDVVVDEDMSLTRRFGVKTSGHTLYYDAGGKLLFSGGITLGRGHEGDNPGFDQLRQCMAESSSRRSTAEYEMVAASVFGCPLFSGGD